ncbi:uncharacterized protein C8orf88 homolog [Neosynchiropus ocellatus]
MEVSRKRLFQKHLEPARPLRRCTQVDVQVTKDEPIPAAPLCERPVMDYKITLEQFFRILNLNKPTERLCYSRDVLLRLASCADARKKPACLPEHPVVLTEALQVQVSGEAEEEPGPQWGGQSRRLLGFVFETTCPARVQGVTWLPRVFQVSI